MASKEVRAARRRRGTSLAARVSPAVPPGNRVKLALAGLAVVSAVAWYAMIGAVTWPYLLLLPTFWLLVWACWAAWRDRPY